MYELSLKLKLSYKQCACSIFHVLFMLIFS